jgi:putative cell wall-binding protein
LFLCALAAGSNFVGVDTGHAATVIPFIVDGEDASPEYGDYVARIVTQDNRLCTGTFISPSWVLTAGHCIADRAEIYVGSTRANQLVSKGRSTGFRHPYYISDYEVPRFDFGLYELDSPASLATSSLPNLVGYDDQWAWTPGGSALTIGWGLTDPDGSLTTTLQEASLTVLDDGTCEELDRSLGAVFDPTTALCANDSVASACNGDSGGPLLVRNSEGSLEILGVTSYGPENCDGHSVFGWIPSGLSWIRSVTGLPLGSGAESVAERTVTRIFGMDRYETAAAVGAFWEQTDTVFVATGGKFPDALAAGSTAASLGSPVLLVNGNVVPEATRYQIRRLSPSTIYVAGGPLAIDDGVVAELGSIVGSQVVRLGGADRYETSDLLGQLIDNGNRGKRVWVASGRDFADPLVASTAAAVFDEPFVLIDGIKPLPERTRQRLVDLAPSKIVVLGPDASFGKSVRDSLGAIASDHHRGRCLMAISSRVGRFFEFAMGEFRNSRKLSGRTGGRTLLGLGSGVSSDVGAQDLCSERSTGPGESPRSRSASALRWPDGAVRDGGKSAALLIRSES